MVAPVFEHITAIMVVSMLFVSAVIAVPAISYVNLFYVDQQQLRNVALEALNSMLLSMGYPSNWGSDFDNLTKFGLALEGSSSFYVLDPNKVQRLVINPSGYLNYSDVRDLLGLHGYGFNIMIVPSFNVTVTLLNSTRIGDNLLLSFNVAVKFNGGMPIPNAIVQATTLYVQTDKKTLKMLETSPVSTDELGLVSITEELKNVDGNNYIAVFKTTVGGKTTVTAFFSHEWMESQQRVQSSIVGNTLTLWIPDEPPQGTRWVRSLFSVSENGVVNLGNFTDEKFNPGEGWGNQFQTWEHTIASLNYESPLFLIGSIELPVPGEGQPNRLFVFLHPNWVGYRVFSLVNATTFSNSGAIKLSRNVEIGGMSYIFELLLWKEV
jgi:hypothetical protein